MRRSRAAGHHRPLDPRCLRYQAEFPKSYPELEKLWSKGDEPHGRRTLEEFTTSLPFTAALAVLGIVVAVNGGKIAAHRALVTRLVSIRGAPAVAIGLVMLALGLAAVVVAWMRGLAWT